MARSGGPTVGLDIGSCNIKAVEIVPGRGGNTVRALGMIATPPDVIENGIIIDPQQLGQAVKTLLKDSGISSKNSVSSVSGQSALVVRVIEVPQMSDSELAETMRYEVERHVPFAANEVIMDFQPIHRADTADDAANMEVLLAVAQQDMIDKHVEMLFAAGLTPSAIDVEPLAVARTYIELTPDPLGQKTVAIVNIGHLNTDIAIFRDGILSFPRVLPLAGTSFTRSIMGHMGMSQDQAEEYKKTYAEVIMQHGSAPAQQAAADPGFLDFSAPPTLGDDSGAKMPFDFSEPSDTEPTNLAMAAAAEAGGVDPFGIPGDSPFGEPIGADTAPALTTTASSETHDPNKLQVFTAIAPVIGELLTEVRRSMEYYQGRGLGAIDEILLCGGSANITNMDTFFTSELGIPTRLASPFEHVTVAAKSYSPEYLEGVSSQFAVAVGLAVRDMVSVKMPVPAGGKKRGKKK